MLHRKLQIYELQLILHDTMPVTAIVRVTFTFTNHIASYRYFTTYLMFHKLHCKLLLISEVTL